MKTETGQAHPSTQSIILFADALRTFVESQRVEKQLDERSQMLATLGLDFKPEDLKMFAVR